MNVIIVLKKPSHGGIAFTSGLEEILLPDTGNRIILYVWCTETVRRVQHVSKNDVV
jgi:hypothetical protein